MPASKKRFKCAVCDAPMKALSGLTTIDGSCGGTKCSDKMGLICTDKAVMKGFAVIQKLWALPLAERDSDVNAALIDDAVNKYKIACGAALAANAATTRLKFQTEMAELTQLTLASVKKTKDSIVIDADDEKNMEELEKLANQNNEALGFKVRGVF